MNRPDVDELNLLHATICKALGDPTRIQILYTLADAPRHVSALAEELDTPQPTISRHLAILRERRLVDSERDGVLVVYSLAEPRLVEVLDQMRSILHSTLARQSQAIT